MRVTKPALLAATLGLSACHPLTSSTSATTGATTGTDMPGNTTTCGVNTLQALVGLPAAEVEFTQDPAALRIIPPNSAVTMDFRADRVNVDTDAKGMITRIWCG